MYVYSDNFVKTQDEYGLGLLLDNTAYKTNKWKCIGCDDEKKRILLFALDVSDTSNFLRRVSIPHMHGHLLYETTVEEACMTFGTPDLSLEDVVDLNKEYSLATGGMELDIRLNMD